VQLLVYFSASSAASVPCLDAERPKTRSKKYSSTDKANRHSTVTKPTSAAHTNSSPYCFLFFLFFLSNYVHPFLFTASIYNEFKHTHTHKLIFNHNYLRLISKEHQKAFSFISTFSLLVIFLVIISVTYTSIFRLALCTSL